MAAYTTRRSTCQKHLRFLCTIFVVIASTFPAPVSAAYDFYSFSADDPRGVEVSLNVFRGKPALVVNVASECGYTEGHYEDLVWLSKQPEMNERLHILAFPCNQFGQQEPASNQEILDFVQKTYGVTFPVFGKIDVIGKYAHPAYIYLSNASGKQPTWNFWKYLVDRQGRVIDAWEPTTSVREIYDFLVAATQTRSGRRDEF
ncbi:glutathione peroxidase 7-like isoform X2 [Acanthaster planci]|uniref:Glutathione peroxidase n=1 Tax=Acanthaster planci TaxID=133434 RepID=A0A8B7Z9Q1_ACAPL|nr:glutathione peroxidase 7-like isoform X2 [Acanthaster planci]